MDNTLNGMDADFDSCDICDDSCVERLIDRIIEDLPIPLKLALAVGITEN